MLKVIDRLGDVIQSETVLNNVRLQPGETLHIRDALGADPGVNQLVIQVVAFNPVLGVAEDQENVTLERVAGSATLYTGSIQTARMPDGLSGTLNNNGTLDARGRHVLQMASPAVGGNPAAVFPALGETVRFATRALLSFVQPDTVPSTLEPGEVSAFKIGDQLFARIDDDDRNADPTSVETLLGGAAGAVGPLEVRDGLAAGDRESINLVETGADTGVFIGAMPTRFTAGAATINNGVLEKTDSTTQGFLGYDDTEFPNPAAPPGALVDRTQPVAVLTGAAPPVDLNASIPIFLVSQPLAIEVTDRALNVANAPETSTVTVRVVAFTGVVPTDAETVVLGSATGGVFRGTVGWAFGALGTAQDGVLTVPVGGSADALYTAAVGPLGEPDFTVGIVGGPQAAPGVGAPAIEFVTGPDGTVPLPAGSNVAATDTLFVRVVDPGLVDRPVAGTSVVRATVSAAPHFNSAELVLRELPFSPGTFVGAVPLTDLDPAVGPDGTLRVRGNDVVTATAIDSSGLGLATINSPLVATVADVRVQADPGTGSPPAPDEAAEVRRIRAGADSVQLVVRDDDRNADPTVIDTLGVNVTTVGAGDAQAFVLTETGADTGVFTRRVDTRFGAAVLADGLVQAVANGVNAGVDEIVVTYTDPALPILRLTPDFVRTVDAEAGADGLLTAAPAALLPGTVLTLTVGDGDARANTRGGPGNDTVRVTLTSRDGGGVVIDEEAVDLPERPGPGSLAGQFGATVPVSYRVAGLPAAVSGDGVITVVATGAVTAGYVDSLRLSGEPEFSTQAVLPVGFAGGGPALSFVADLDGNGARLRAQPGDGLIMRLDDLNSNRTADVDTATVLLTSSTGTGAALEDQELVRLVETGASTGVFTGAVPTRFGSVILDGNGQVDVRGRDLPGQPQVRATFTSPGGLAAVAGLAVDVDGRPGFVDNAAGIDRGVAQVAAGEGLFPRVEDDDLNADPAAADTVNVTVRTFIDLGAGPTQLDIELFTLVETGVNTGVFVAGAAFPNGLPTAFRAAGGPAVAGVVEINDTGGGFVQLEYNDLDTASGVPAAPRISGPLPVASGADGTLTLALASGGAPPLTPASGGFRVNVVDLDARAAPRSGPGNDTVRVTLTSRDGGGALVDEETIDVEESGAPAVGAAGQFERRVPARFRAAGAGAGVRGDGIVEVVAGGNVVMGYTDELGLLGQGALVRETAAVPVAFVGAAPVVSFPAELGGTGTRVRIQPGDLLLVRVADADANVSSEVDVVVIALTTAPGAGAGLQDAEVARLTETGPDTGVFTGFIATRFGTVVITGDGQLQVRGRDAVGQPAIQATYTSPNGQPPVVQGLAVEVDGEITFVAGAAGPGQARVFAVGNGDRLFAQVIDDDLNVNTAAEDTVTVTISSFINAGATLLDQELSTLTESGANTGLFLGPAGGLPASLSAVGTPGNGTLEINVTGGGTVTAEHDDTATSTGVAVTRRDTIGVGGAAGGVPTVGVVELVSGREPSAVQVRRVAPGNTLFVRVTDPDAAPLSSGQTSSVSVTVVSGPAGDQDTEFITLTGTATGGVFTGEIQTRFGQTQGAGARSATLRDPDNGVLEVRGRDSVVVSYQDAAPAGLRTNLAPLEVECDARLTAQETRAEGAGGVTTVTVGGELCAQVTDDDENRDRSSVETVILTATSAAPLNDQENVTLRETGPDTGVFTGCVGTRSGQLVAVINDGVLDTQSSATRTRTGAFTVAYADQRVPFPAAAAIAPAVNKSLALDGSFGQVSPPSSGTITLSGGRSDTVRAGERERLNGGAPLLIVVTDADADRTPTPDTVTVRITVTASAGSVEAFDVETVRLVETGNSTGVFGPANLGVTPPCNASVRPNVPTNFGPRNANDCAVTVAGGEVVTVAYVEDLDASGAVPQAPFDQLTVETRYRTQLTLNNGGNVPTRLDLPNGARLEVPPAAVFRPLDATFELRFGDVPPGVSVILDESNNPVPPPIRQGINLLQMPGSRAFWYELQPSRTNLRRPARMFLPVPSDARTPGSSSAVSAVSSRLRIVFFDGFDWLTVGGTFVPRGTDTGVPDFNQDYVVASVNHFTTFALAVDDRTPPAAGGPLISGLAISSNPFTPNRDGINDVTTISLGLAESSFVTLKIFDVTGELARTLIQDTVLSSGFVSQQWDGSYLFAARIAPAGLYLVEVTARSVLSGRKARETIMLGVVK